MTDAFLNMPRLGETMEEGTISAWLIAPGEAFKRGDVIIVVETDKTAVEFPALGPGVLREHLKQEGELVLVGEPIARVDIGEGPDWTLDANVEGTEQEEESHSAPPSSAHRETSAPQRTVSGKVRATPVARRLARLGKREIDEISGTGRRGRVEKWDVEAVLAADGNGDTRFFHEIACTCHGPVGGVPFIMIHGFSGDRTTFAGLANGLSRAGCRVVAMDLPGHGASRLEAENPQDLSKNLTEFVARVIGPVPFHLVAHSLGAVPALELARAIMPISLTLIAPAGLGLKLDREFISGMADPGSIGHVRELLGRLTNRPLGLSAAALEKLYGELAKGRLKALANSLLNSVGQVPDIKPALREVGDKTLARVLVGHRDCIIDWQDACALASNIAVHHFTHGGHMVHWDQPAEVLRILLHGVHNDQSS
ncbi:MAG TPA: alpha/beta fold hydrolase [Devosia sp.]|nr:alpha/beta fold hydrolase [Devosia sp.]